MKNTKIAIISPSLAGGGAEKIAINLANEYSKMGFKVDLVLFEAKGEYMQQVSSSVNVVGLNIRAVHVISVFYVRKYLKHNKPDVVLSVIRKSNIKVGFASLGMKNLRIVFREASTLQKILQKSIFKRNIDLIKMKFAYGQATQIIANSQDTANSLLSKGIVSKDKIAVISNPVLNNDYLELSQKPIVDDFLDNNALKTIITIGRLNYSKNHSLLIKAFKLVNEKRPNTRLIIIGEGDQKKNITELINVLGLKSVVKIMKFKQNIFPYLKHASLFALTSLWEGFGNVIVEALALGKPIVCTDCPGGPKYILEKGRYGKLIPVDNPELFSEAIITSLDEPVDSESLKKRAKDFSVETIIEKYSEVLFSSQNKTEKIV